MNKDEWPDILLAVAVVLAFVVVFFCVLNKAHSRDLGQWDKSSELSKWYQTLMMPDNPGASCCGEADAYWCDILKTESVDGKAKNYCIITDDRPDEPRQRPHIEIGTEIEIPDHKMNRDPNPTGHAIVFVSKMLYVYCFVMAGGV